MPIADNIINLVETSSPIREMFEEGLRLKNIHGEENVFDFSLGNPDVAPPIKFKQVLKGLVNDESLFHGYMSTSGHPHVRQAVADYLNKEHNLDITPDLIVMSVGAAGAINDVLKSLINPGEEILVPAPYFAGYNQYAFNANAHIKTATTDDHFHLDINTIEAAITEKTRIMLINSPNNPTGAVYHVNELNQLGDLLEQMSKKFGKRIYLISDEPYRRIVYSANVPSIFNVYPHTIMVTSFSKELSLAGERIGYLAIHPEAEDANLIADAASVVNTMLYVNAPSLMQLAIAKLQDVTINVSLYQKRRDILCEGLKTMGYEFETPQGAFYLFPKSPFPDDIEFTRILKEELILVTPGVGFAGPGHFRIAYCVPESTIERSLKGFKRAIDKI